jgi:hypothetical protein
LGGGTERDRQTLSDSLFSFLAPAVWRPLVQQSSACPSQSAAPSVAIWSLHVDHHLRDYQDAVCLPQQSRAMASTELNDPARRDEWIRHVEACRPTTLSMRACCRRHRLSVGIFRRWALTSEVPTALLTLNLDHPMRLITPR